MSDTPECGGSDAADDGQELGTGGAGAAGDELDREKHHRMLVAMRAAKRQLLCDEDLPKYVRVKRSDEHAVLYLIGTAHVSEESVRDVHELVQRLKPDTTVIELCRARAHLALGPRKGDKGQREDGAGGDGKDEGIGAALQTALSMMRSGNSAAAFSTLLVSALSSMLRDIDSPMGEEFRVATHETMKWGGDVVLGDRDIRVTMQRAWSALSTIERVKLLYMIGGQLLLGIKVTKEDIEQLKSPDMMAEAMETLARHFPSICVSILGERDQYLCATIRRVTQESAPGRVVVAVVGLGHADGIWRHWDSDIDVDELNKAAAEGMSLSRFILSFIAVHVVVLLIVMWVTVPWLLSFVW